MKVSFYEQVPDEKLKFAVVASCYYGKWVFVKHKERTTFELCGGHREAGETIEETAKRELMEESGALRFSIYPICAYSVIGKTRANESGEETFGMLYYADIAAWGAIHSEIEKAELFDELPSSLTYPAIQPLLFAKAKEYARRYFDKTERG